MTLTINNVILILLSVHAHTTLYLNIYGGCSDWVAVLHMILGVLGRYFIWIAYLVVKLGMMSPISCLGQFGCNANFCLSLLVRVNFTLPG
jgi:hypothetical protein